jgi:UDP-N-acetylenolpyruvoylglucosamine reductase
MCKIDYLGTGLCPAGEENHFVSYYPQGRMDLVKAIAEGTLSVTERLVDIANTCTLCGDCDLQCHFVSELRPMPVMKELKRYVEEHISSGKPILREKLPGDEDPLLTELQKVTGEKWASDDPAITMAYFSDPSPVTIPKNPRAVVLPGSAEEVQGIVRVAKQFDVPWMVRGNGSSVMGFVMTEGILIDTQRMKTVDFDENNWCVTIGAGVSAWDLQKAALERGFRVNVAEPAALVCANVMCSGIMSLFSAAYGTLDDGYVDAEFVSSEGERFNLKDEGQPNLYRFSREDHLCSMICTSVKCKIHPVTDDEEGFLVPAETLQEALVFMRMLSQRRVGFGLGVLGADYVATFISPESSLARRVKDFFENTLKTPFMVMVLGDAKDRTAVENMGRTVLSNDLFRALMLGIPKLTPAPGQHQDNLADILQPVAEADGIPLIHLLGRKDLMPVITAALTPSPETHALAVPEDLRPAYAQIYEKPEMTDLVWLNMFRILSSRMGREKHLLPLVLYVPLDKPEVIGSLVEGLRGVADSLHLKNDFGFVSPIDFGKRAFLEYDFYLDQNDPQEIQHSRMALAAAAELIEKTSASVPGVQWIRYTLNQGCCRKENLLYST